MAHLMSSWQYSCHLMSSDSPLLVMVINFTHFLVCLLCILISVTLTTWHVIWCQDSYTPVAVLCCHDSSITSQFIKISSSCHLLSLWHPCPCYLMASHLYPCHMSSRQLYPSCHYHHDSSLFSSDVTMTAVPIVIRCHMSADHIVWCHHDNCPSCCLVSPWQLSLLTSDVTMTTIPVVIRCQHGNGPSCLMSPRQLSVVIWCHLDMTLPDVWLSPHPCTSHRSRVSSFCGRSWQNAPGDTRHNWLQSAGE